MTQITAPEPLPREGLFVYTQMGILWGGLLFGLASLMLAAHGILSLRKKSRPPSLVALAWLVMVFGVVFLSSFLLQTLLPQTRNRLSSEKPSTLPSTHTPTPIQQKAGTRKFDDVTRYVNQFGYWVDYDTALPPQAIEDDLTLSWMSFENLPGYDKGNFSVVVNDTTLKKQVELEKWKVSHAIMESVKEKQIVKDGFLGVRLDFVPRPDVGKPTSTAVIHNGTYSYIINAATEDFDGVFSNFHFFITVENATKTIQNLPDVQVFLQRVGTRGKITLDGDVEGKNAYLIHVYELLSDHTATFNWYEVDKVTGSVRAQF